VDAGGNLLWSVVQNSYDANGNLIATSDSANFLSSATRVNYSSTAAWIASVTPNHASDRTSYMVYDDADREIFSIDALGDVRQSVYDANGNVITQVAYAKPVSVSGPITTEAQVQNLESQLANGQSWSDWSSWVGNAQYQVNNGQNPVNNEQNPVNNEQNQITATVYDAANRAVFQINALGYVTQNTYDGNGNVAQTTAYANGVNPNLAASAPSIADVQQSLYDGGTTDRITYHVFDADNRLIYTVNANGFVTQNIYNALGQVTQTIQYAQSNTPLNFTVTPPSAADIVSRLIDGSNGNDYLSDSNNRITSFQYDAQGNLTLGIDALGNKSLYTYNGLNEKLTYINALNAVWNYAYDAAGNMVSETDPTVSTTNATISNGITDTATDSYTPAVATQANAQLQTLTTYDAFGDVTSNTQQQIVGGSSKGSLVRLTQYQYDLAGRQTETLLPAVNAYSTTDNLAQNGADNQINGVATREETASVTPTTIVTYDALGNAISNRDAAGDLSYKAYNSVGQVTYAVDADGYVTGYQYDAFGNVIALTRYANAVSIAPGSAVTTAMIAAALTPNASLDRVVQTQYDQLNQVIAVIDPASQVYGESEDASETLGLDGNNGIAGSTGMVYDVEYNVTSNSYDAFGDLIEQSVTGQSVTDSSLDTVGSNTVYYYDNMGNKVATLTQADDGYVDATQESAGLPTLEGYRSCFVKGTLIHTENGLTPIEAIGVGDRVLSQPEQAGDTCYKPVVRTFVTPGQSIWRISIDHGQAGSESFLVTHGHPFWVKGTGWTPANRLQIGQALQLRDHSEAVVAAVEDTGS
ncbi:MAG TPA: polymorphic toxin-type HINT domain-containing protein, partial [Burkholderiaceae bacterium]|nr:polymorphic toxin-type HINT domain-containing protein [Burkholderiaceae bacterium]